MLTTIAAYSMVTRDLAETLDRTAKQPQIARETAYYLDNISKVKNIDDFLGDDRIFRYAMKAHGLDEMSYAKAFMRKALEEGIDDPRSFANTLADPRYKAFVATFNFARHGEAATAFGRAQQATADLYVRQTLEIDQGNSNEGVRLALYFERKAPELQSVYGILADKALLTVVQTALGIPREASMQNIDRQAETLSKRLDLDDFRDPQKLGRFIEQFAALWDVSSRPATSSMPSAFGVPGTSGLSMSVLTQIQNIKLGGR